MTERRPKGLKDLTSDFKSFPVALLFCAHHVDYRPAPPFPQPPSPSQRSQVLPCVHPDRCCMGYPRSITAHLAPHENPWMAGSQNIIPLFAGFHACRVHHRRYARHSLSEACAWLRVSTAVAFFDTKWSQAVRRQAVLINSNRA